ncbi:hypothetical protein [Rhodococcus sp. 15-649-2-2]|uniref:hypothetical protein n=1 Tax=Rhodococcus sp. 15-649-2-2 TaxID=2023140 RepID=UPI00117BAC46|nr:hypothetical protein [Rhodococcus sp. 15-649-2-2]
MFNTNLFPNAVGRARDMAAAARKSQKLVAGYVSGAVVGACSGHRRVGSEGMTIESGALVHYHSTALELDRGFDYSKEHQRTDKPTGLWVSIAGEDDWESWCRLEEYAVDALAVPHLVTLADSANILILTTVNDLVEFDSEYGIESTYASRTYRFEVDWPRLYGEFDGIIIAPYQWSQRHNGPQWYWGWDCASGCIWNLDAIAAFEPSVVPV